MILLAIHYNLCYYNGVRKVGVMKKVLDLKFLVEEMIDISGRYLPGDLDGFYYEIKDNLNAEGIVDKKDVMKAIKNCKNVDFRQVSITSSKKLTRDFIRLVFEKKTLKLNEGFFLQSFITFGIIYLLVS